MTFIPGRRRQNAPTKLWHVSTDVRGGAKVKKKKIFKQYGGLIFTKLWIILK
jgi:hypothetical protein